MKRGGPLKRTTPLKAGKPLARGKGLKRGTSKLTTKTQLKSTKPPAPMSDKTKADLPRRAKVRAAVKQRDNHRCQLAGTFPDVRCGGPLTFHHIIKASQGGDYSEEDGTTACQVHNDLVEDRPDVARAAGWVRSARPPTKRQLLTDLP